MEIPPGPLCRASAGLCLLAWLVLVSRASPLLQQAVFAGCRLSVLKKGLKVSVTVLSQCSSCSPIPDFCCNISSFLKGCFISMAIPITNSVTLNKYQAATEGFLQGEHTRTLKKINGIFFFSSLVFSFLSIPVHLYNHRACTKCIFVKF